MRGRPRRSFVLAALGVALVVPTQAGAGDWSMFHRTPGHSGVTPETTLGSAAAPSLGARWMANTGAGVFGSPVVATDRALGRVAYVGNQAGTMSAYDADTGDRIWARDLPAAIASTPAVKNGVVYFGAHDHWFYALDAATGAVRCKMHTGGIVSSSPVLANPDGKGIVAYFGDNGLSGNDDGGRLWAVNGVSPNASEDCSTK